MASLCDWTSLAKLDPEFEQVVSRMGGLPDMGSFPDIPSLRKFIEAAIAARATAGGVTSNVPDVKETDYTVTMRDEAKITCRVYQQEGPPSRGCPLYVIYHGGGFCVGTLDNEEPLCRLLTSQLGLVVVNVDYRLAPEHKFPIAVYDAYDAARWAAVNAPSLGADPSKGFIIGGTSAGGNLAAVIEHLWQDNKQTPKLTGSHLMAPILVHPSVVPEKYAKDYQSWDQLEFAPILNRKACNLYIENYIPKQEDRADPNYSPLLHEGAWKDCPPTYLQVCGMDPLRDESLIYERILRQEHGVKTKIDVYPGVPHVFWTILSQMEVSKKFTDESVQGVKWLLEQQ